MSNQCLRPPSIMKLKRKKFAKREDVASPYLKETTKTINKKQVGSICFSILKYKVYEFIITLWIGQASNSLNILRPNIFQRSSTKSTVNPFKSKSQNLFDLKTRSKSEADRSLYDQLSKPTFQKTVSYPNSNYLEVDNKLFYASPSIFRKV